MITQLIKITILNYDQLTTVYQMNVELTSMFLLFAYLKRNEGYWN